MMYIAFEGVDGTGKSTMVERATQFLNNAGWGAQAVKCPGTTELGMRIHHMLHTLEGVSQLEYQLLCTVAGLSLEPIVDGCFEDCRNVVADRWNNASRYAYWMAMGGNEQQIFELETMAILTPPSYFILLVTEDVGGCLARNKGVEVGENYAERAGVTFLERVQHYYLRAAEKSMWAPWWIVDATPGRGVDEVWGDCHRIIGSKMIEIELAAKAGKGE